VAGLDAAVARLAMLSGQVADYCERGERLEATDPAEISAIGSRLRRLALELADEANRDPVGVYRTRLDAIEQQHPLYPALGYLAVDELPDEGATWRTLQAVQWDHDCHYRPAVFGLSECERLRRSALQLAKLAGCAAAISAGEPAELDPLLADILVVGVELATLTNERLPNEPVG
jgi:hypothetical protein